MSELDDKPAKKSKEFKQLVQKDIYNKLAQVFASYRNDVNAKKFDRKFKKAIKLFTPLILKSKTEDKN